MESRDYISHIRRIGEEKLDEAGEKRYPARRWIVERTLGWLSKCRAILKRKEGRQLPGTHQGRLYLAVLPSSAPLVPFEIVT